MNIAGTEYNLNHKAIEVYLPGCDGVCEGCHNSGLWDFNIGVDWDLPFNLEYLSGKLADSMVNKVWIMGGEPLLQDNNELEKLIHWISDHSRKEIWLWTRFQVADIPKNIKQYLTYAKVGEYVNKLSGYSEPCFDIKLASTNQKLIKLSS